jgi:hypothetical protein
MGRRVLLVVLLAVFFALVGWTVPPDGAGLDVGDALANGGTAGAVVYALIRGTLRDLGRRLDRIEALYFRRREGGDG